MSHVWRVESASRGEILSSYADEGDGALLIEYGDRMRHRSLFKRLGFLVEQLSSVIDSWTRAWLGTAPGYPSRPRGPRGGARFQPLGASGKCSGYNGALFMISDRGSRR